MPEFSAPDGTRLHFTDEGEGPPILCLAGLTRNGNDFGYVTPHLNRNRLIRMDYRGRGKSEWTDHATYSIPNEAADALALLDHLGIERAAILGTSRGGLIAMVIAATAKDRLTGLALNDIGPELMAEGLADIDAYLGRRPKAQTFEEAAAMRASLMPGFEGVPHSRWAEEVRIHYTNTADGLNINYDPALRDAVAAAAMQPAPDLWPLFAALDGLPLALIRGKNSNLLSTETAKKMRTLRPDLIYADVPGRGHVPFLDEPEALAVLHEWRTHLP